MKLTLFVEGETELGLRDFFQRWLSPPRIPERNRIGISIVCLRGSGHFHEEIAEKVATRLAGADVLGGIGLLDLYGLSYPKDKRSVDERYRWAKQQMEQRVGHAKFRQHFAVHETEAWFLADPQILPRKVAEGLPSRCERPETVNFDEPPAKLLSRIYRETKFGYYKKRVHGIQLLQKLSPERAAAKCPYLKLLLDDMLALAKQALP